LEYSHSRKRDEWRVSGRSRSRQWDAFDREGRRAIRTQARTLGGGVSQVASGRQSDARARREVRAPTYVRRNPTCTAGSERLIWPSGPLPVYRDAFGRDREACGAYRDDFGRYPDAREAYAAAFGRYQHVRGAYRHTFGLYREAREVYLEGQACIPEPHDADLKA
jgi:hypothetical protein